jgi:acetoin utilization protein AcuB
MSDPHHATTVQEHMTCEPLTIGGDVSLSEAAQLMKGRNIRHLPVVSGDKVAGVISERDLHVARTLRSLNLEKATVELVMSSPALVVPPDARLSDVAARMIDRKVGSAVVVHEGRVVGIFTSHDALLALHSILAAQT